jgi:hypothetical protein
MSAIEALRKSRAAGLGVAIDGEDLVLHGSAPPPAAVLDALSRYKTDIIMLLRADQGDRIFDEERASNQANSTTAATEVKGVRWAEWRAGALNRLFREQGVTGQPGRITGATVRHGESNAAYKAGGVFTLDCAATSEPPMLQAEATS